MAQALFETFKFISRLIKHLTILILVCIPLEILGILILLPICWFSRNSIYLPKALRWFDNADLYVGRDPKVYLEVCQKGTLYRYYWLALRNPLNYFGYTRLGVCLKTEIKALYETISTPPVGDTTKAGLYRCEALIDEKRYFEYYLIYKYPFWPTLCFRFRMGHKLKMIKDNKLGDYIQFVMVISPFHSYTGV